MRELRDLRAFRVDLLCLCRRHLRFERRRGPRFFHARDGPPPCRPRLLWSTLAAQRAFRTNCLSCVVYVRVYPVATIQHCMMSEHLPPTTRTAVPLRIVGTPA